MIRLLALGGAELARTDGTEVRSVLTQPKRLALLVYLAAATPGGFHRRDTLLGLFWPKLDEERGRAALSQALYYLRRSLGEGVVVARGREEVGVSPDRLWCDVVAVEDGLDSDEPEDLAAALELYRGELLPGYFVSDAPEFERWLEDQRGRLRRRAAEAAWTLSRQAQAERRTKAAMEWGRRALMLSGYDESQLRRLIDLLDRAGDRAGAVRIYEEIAEQLARVYEIDPSPETQRRIAEIRARVAPEGQPAAAVTSAAPPAPSSGAEMPPPDAGERVESRRAAPWRWLAPSAPVVGAVALLVGFLRGPGGADTEADAAPGALDANRVAVLPLANLSPDDGDAYIAEGVTAELIARLERLQDLRMIPRSSVDRYRDAPRSVSEIGRELGVGTVIEGNTHLAGDSVRITIFLTDINEEELLWTRVYDAPFADILDLQRRIADDVALELKVATRAESASRRVHRWPDRLAAEEYLRGHALLGQQDKQALVKARDHFRRALERDSSFAEAWSGLAASYHHMANRGLMAGPRAWYEAARAAERALAYDDELPEAHIVLARAESMGQWDAQMAERHFRRAIELDPSDLDARIAYGKHLRNLGRLEEALEEIRQAQKLDPRAVEPRYEEATVLYFLRRPEEAIALLETYLAMPDSEPGGPPGKLTSTEVYASRFWPRFTLAMALEYQGKNEAALSALDAADPLDRYVNARAVRGYLHAKMGRDDEARQALETLDRVPNAGPASDFHRALIHLGLGEHDRALDLLASAAGERTQLLGLLKMEPKFEPLHGRPRFEALLRRLDLEEDPGMTERRLDGGG